MTIPLPLSDADNFPNLPPKLVLIGPPGTGKTRACLDRWILPALLAGESPYAVLSCSFTRAAAGELRARLAKATGHHERDLRRTCSTIHAEAFRLLRIARPDLELWASVPDPEDVDEEDIDPPAQAIESLAKSFTKNVAQASISAWHRARASLRPQSLATFALETSPEIPSETVEACVREYEAAKKAQRAMDFTDLLIMALDNQQCSPPDRTLLILDEAQDCSPLQWALINRWATTARHFVIVGDGDQCVHSWAGASLDHFYGSMHDAQIRRLTKSHRVPRAAHRHAQRILKSIRHRFESPYEPADHEGSIFWGQSSDALTALADATASSRQTFFLCPTSRRCLEWAIEITRAHIPASVERGSFRPLKSKSRLEALIALLQLRTEGIPDRDGFAKLLARIPAHGSGVFLRTKKAALEAAEDLYAPELEDSGFVDLSPLSGQLEAVYELLGFHDEARQGPMWKSVFEMLLRHGPDRCRNPAVTLTTFHASKGREADLVVLDLFLPKPVASSTDLDPWRRVLYVGVTRTKNALLCLGSDLDRFLRS